MPKARQGRRAITQKSRFSPRLLHRIRRHAIIQSQSSKARAEQGWSTLTIESDARTRDRTQHELKEDQPRAPPKEGRTATRSKARDAKTGRSARKAPKLTSGRLEHKRPRKEGTTMNEALINAIEKMREYTADIDSAGREKFFALLINDSQTACWAIMTGHDLRNAVIEDIERAPKRNALTHLKMPRCAEQTDFGLHWKSLRREHIGSRIRAIGFIRTTHGKDDYAKINGLRAEAQELEVLTTLTAGALKLTDYGKRSDAAKRLVNGLNKLKHTGRNHSKGIHDLLSEAGYWIEVKGNEGRLYYSEDKKGQA